MRQNTKNEILTESEVRKCDDKMCWCNVFKGGMRHTIKCDDKDCWCQILDRFDYDVWLPIDRKAKHR